MIQKTPHLHHIVRQNRAVAVRTRRDIAFDADRHGVIVDDQIVHIPAVRESSRVGSGVKTNIDGQTVRIFQAAGREIADCHFDVTERSRTGERSASHQRRTHYRAFQRSVEFSAVSVFDDVIVQIESERIIRHRRNRQRRRTQHDFQIVAIESRFGIKAMIEFQKRRAGQIGRRDGYGEVARRALSGVARIEVRRIHQAGRRRRRVRFIGQARRAAAEIAGRALENRHTAIGCGGFGQSGRETTARRRRLEGFERERSRQADQIARRRV